MKQFWAFIKIEFFHIFRDRRTMLILLGMPVLQIILFGFAITTELNHSRVAVLDPSKDAVTTRITERIDENRYFSVVKELSSASDIETVFRHDEADIVVAFTPDFDANLSTGEAGIQLVVDATDPNTGNMMAGYVQGIVGQALQSGTQSSPIVQTHLLFNPQMKSAYNFVPGVMGLILMLICAMMTSISIVREKETGTMEVLLVSPIRPIFIILAKAVPYLVLSCVNLATILLLSVYVLHAGGGKPLDAVFPEPPSDCGGSVFGIAHFMRGTKTSGGHDRVGYGTDDACHVAFRHDFSHRKHAGCPAVDFQYHSGKVVHTGRKEGDDRRLGHGRRMA